MASASLTRSSMTVEVEQPLSELCGALCGVQIEVGPWVSIEFDVSAERRGVATAARLVVEDGAVMVSP